MGFSASTRQFGDVTVVDIRGRFTMIEGDAIHDLLMDLIEDGRKKLLLNLRDVTYLDSSGVGQLVRSLKAVEKHGAQLKAVELSQHVAEVLKLVNLHLVFPDYPDEQTALRSFFN